MNKNRIRTQRRLAERAAGRSTRSLSRKFRRSLQRINADRIPVVLDNVFEVQRRDKSGRWRKAAGIARVHTFGLARLRAHKSTLPVVDADNCGHELPALRVRNIKTGDTWTL